MELSSLFFMKQIINRLYTRRCAYAEVSGLIANDPLLFLEERVRFL